MKKHYNVGAKNGMFGKIGKDNPNHKHGKTLIKSNCIDCKKELGKLAFFIGTKRCKSCENKRRFKEGILNTTGKNNVNYGKKSLEHSQRLKNLWKTEEYRKKIIKAIQQSLQIKPNQKEKLLNELLNGILPNQYKINVKAEILILGTKIPDFVNIIGKNKVIEMFGDYYHSDKFIKKYGCYEDTEKGRIKYFKKLGWNCLIIWEHELKDLDKLKQKILIFNKF